MNDLSYMAYEVDWLISEFVGIVPGVAHAVVFSCDGLPLASSSGFPIDRTDRLAAITAGLVGLSEAAAGVLEGGGVMQSSVEMDNGMMLTTMSIGEGSCLAVLAGPESDMALVAYHMTLMAERTGQVLTPAVRRHLRASQSRVMQTTDRHRRN
ncbi:roadblock/LC7 domain-containing protein [Nonomuraea sp. NPDC050643]|uniref:roadblock/LC7 domain-containing protein n=1 Tax=Nonomuraea sp. NPDC050643 TaxID=3155660 RepID=UPI0033E6B82C